MMAARVLWAVIALVHAIAGGSLSLALVIFVIYWLGDYLLEIAA